MPAAGQPASPGRVLMAAATALTWLLKLDVVLFGGVRTGPFFGLGESEAGGGIGKLQWARE